MNDKKCIIILYAIAFLTIVNAFFLYQTRQALTDNAIVLNNKIDAIDIGTDGKLRATEKKLEKLIANNKSTQVIRQEIQYVPKETPDDADIELNTAKPTVTVKVNDETPYKIPLLATETSKFENGKLTIDSAYSTAINIKAYDYPRSKFSLITATNADKEALYGLNYDLGHTVSATVLAGHGVKPYYGLTFRIGAHD